jgi:3-oxoadipate CoA-transferase beta subunit
MTLFTTTGSPKLVRTCTYPLTGLACVNRVYTEQAIFDITDDGLCVLDTFGTTYADLEARLDVPLGCSP